MKFEHLDLIKLSATVILGLVLTHCSSDAGPKDAAGQKPGNSGEVKPGEPTKPGSSEQGTQEGGSSGSSANQGGQTAEFSVYEPTPGDKVEFEKTKSKNWTGLEQEPSTLLETDGGKSEVLFRYKDGAHCKARRAFISEYAGKSYESEMDLGCKLAEETSCKSSCDESGNEEVGKEDIPGFKQAKVTKSWCVTTVGNPAGGFNRIKTETLTYRHNDALIDGRIAGFKTYSCSQLAKTEDDARKIKDPCKAEGSNTVMLSRTESNFIAKQTKGNGTETVEVEASGFSETEDGKVEGLHPSCNFTKGMANNLGMSVYMPHMSCKDGKLFNQSLAIGSLAPKDAAATPFMMGQVNFTKGAATYMQMNQRDCEGKDLKFDTAKRLFSGKVECKAPLSSYQTRKEFTVKKAEFSCVIPRAALN